MTLTADPTAPALVVQALTDVAPAIAVSVTVVLAAAMFGWSVWLFRSGHKLKP